MQRFDYSAIGDPVNVASRMEGLTKQYGVNNLVSESTARGIDGFAMIEIDKVMVMGREEPTSVYSVVGGRDRASQADFQELKRLHERFLGRYRTMQFEDAAADLALLKSRAPSELEKVYDEYQLRLAKYAVEPPPAGWDGSYRAEHK